MICNLLLSVYIMDESPCNYPLLIHFWIGRKDRAGVQLVSNQLASIAGTWRTSSMRLLSDKIGKAGVSDNTWNMIDDCNLFLKLKL